jgi:hypothetical protein
MNSNLSNHLQWQKTFEYAVFLLAAVTLSASLASGQGVIISISGPPTPWGSGAGFTLSFGEDNPIGVSWAQGSAFSNVGISILLDGDAGATGVAYLTDHVGAGTTAADQIASASFAFPATQSLVPVLSGVDLGSGTYFLTIEQTAAGSHGDGTWLGTASRTVTLAPNVAALGDHWHFGPIEGYPPANVSGGFATTYLEYNVTSFPVPEPPASLLILLGGAIYAHAHRRPTRKARGKGPNN